MARCHNRSSREYKALNAKYNSITTVDGIINKWQQTNKSEKIPDIKEAEAIIKQYKTYFNLQKKEFGNAVLDNLVRQGLVSKWKNNYWVKNSDRLVRKYDEAVLQDNLKKIQRYLSFKNIPLESLKVRRTPKSYILEIQTDLFTKKDILQESRDNDGAHVVDVIQHLGKMFPTVSIDIVSVDEARNHYNSLEEWQKADVPFAQMNSYYVDGQVKLIKGRITVETAIEEVLHPFVDAIYQENKALFNNLLSEAKINFPQLAAQVDDSYSDLRGFNKEDRNLELVTQALSRHFKEEYETKPTATWKDLIQQLLDWLRSVVVDLHKYLTGKALPVSKIRADKTRKGYSVAEKSVGTAIQLLSNEEIDNILPTLEGEKRFDGFYTSGMEHAKHRAIHTYMEILQNFFDIEQSVLPAEAKGITLIPHTRELELGAAVTQHTQPHLIADIGEALDGKNEDSLYKYKTFGELLKALPNNGTRSMLAEIVNEAINHANNPFINPDATTLGGAARVRTGIETVIYDYETESGRNIVETHGWGALMYHWLWANKSTPTWSWQGAVALLVLRTINKRISGQEKSLIGIKKPIAGLRITNKGITIFTDLTDVRGLIIDKRNMSHEEKKVIFKKQPGYGRATKKPAGISVRDWLWKGFMVESIEPRGTIVKQNKPERTERSEEIRFKQVMIRGEMVTIPYTLRLGNIGIYTPSSPALFNDKFKQELELQFEENKARRDLEARERAILRTEQREKKVSAKEKEGIPEIYIPKYKSTMITGLKSKYSFDHGIIIKNEPPLGYTLSLEQRLGTPDMMAKHGEPEHFNIEFGDINENLPDELFENYRLSHGRRQGRQTGKLVIDRPIGWLGGIISGNHMYITEIQSDLLQNTKNLANEKWDDNDGKRVTRSGVENTYKGWQYVFVATAIEEMLKKNPNIKVVSLPTEEELDKQTGVGKGIKNFYEDLSKAFGFLESEAKSVNYFAVELEKVERMMEAYAGEPDGITEKMLREQQFFSILSDFWDTANGRMKDQGRIANMDLEKTFYAISPRIPREAFNYIPLLSPPLNPPSLPPLSSLSHSWIMNNIKDKMVAEIAKSATLISGTLDLTESEVHNLWQKQKIWEKIMDEDWMEMVRRESWQESGKRNQDAIREDMFQGKNFSLDTSATLLLRHLFKPFPEVDARDVFSTAQLDTLFGALNFWKYLEDAVSTKEKLEQGDTPQQKTELSDLQQKGKEKEITGYKHVLLEERKKKVTPESEIAQDVYITTYIKTFVKMQKESTPGLAADFELAQDAITFMVESEPHIHQFLNSEQGQKYLDDKLNPWLEKEFSKDEPTQDVEDTDTEGGVLVTPEGEEIEGEYKESDLDKLVKESLKKPEITYSTVDTDYLLDQLNESIESKDKQRQNIIKQILAEIQAKGDSNIRFLYNPNGTIMGFTHNGKIYLNRQAPHTTLVEEAAHLWLDKIKEGDPTLYNEGLNKIKDTVYVQDVLNESFYHKEALRHGEEGSKGYLEYIEEEALAKAIRDKGKQLSDDERVSFIDWIKRLFAKLRAVMGLHGMSVQQIRKLTLDEFAESALRDIFADQSTETVAEPTTLSDVAKLLNTSGLTFDLEKPVSRKVRYSLTPEMKSIIEHAKSYANPAQKGIIDKMTNQSLKAKEELDSLSIAIDRVVVFNEPNHEYYELGTGVKYRSTTNAIKGEMSAQAKEEKKLNLDIGNDFDILMEGLAASKTYAELKDRMKVIKDHEVTRKAYNTLLKEITEYKAAGFVVLPQIVLSDSHEKIAGKADLILISTEGKLGIIDLKTSKNTVLDEKYDFPYQLEEDSLLKQRGIPELSTRQQHGIQVQTYRRMAENMGYELMDDHEWSMSTFHIRVILNETGTEFTGEFVVENYINHPVSENEVYVNLLVPRRTNIKSAEEIDNITAQYQSGSREIEHDVDPPDEEVISGALYDVMYKALREFKIALLSRREVLEKARNAITMDKTREQSIKEIIDITSAIGVAVTRGSLSVRKEYTKILRYTLNEVDNFIEYTEDPANFHKPEYITYVLNMEKFIDTYRGLASIKDADPGILNKSQSDLIISLISKLDTLVTINPNKPGVIYRAIQNFGESFIGAEGKGFTTEKMSEEELKDILKYAEDIGISESLLYDMDTSSDVILRVMAKVVKFKKLEVLDKIDIRNDEIRQKATALERLSPGGIADYKFMLQYDADGNFTARYIQKIGYDYQRLRFEIKEKTRDAEGEYREYIFIEDMKNARPEDIERNKEIYKARSEWGKFLSAEDVVDGKHIDGEYHKYTKEFQDEREQFEEWIEVEKDWGYWKRKSGVNDIAYAQYEARNYWIKTGVQKMVFVNDEPTGQIKVLPEKKFVRTKNKEIREISRGVEGKRGKDMRDPKYIKIMDPTDALGEAQKAFYLMFRKHFEEELLMKLPMSVRDKMLGKAPLVMATLYESVTGRADWVAKTWMRTTRSAKNIFQNTSHAKRVIVDENGELMDSLPIFFVGNPRSEKALDNIFEEKQSLKKSYKAGDLTRKEYKERTAELNGQAERLRALPAKNEVSQDMGDSLLKFSAMAENYEVMAEIEDTLTALIRLLENRTYKPSTSGKLTAFVGGKLQKVGVKGTSGNILTVNKAKKFMKMVYYDNNKATKQWYNKVTDGIIRYSSLSYVAFNVFGNINNYTIARINNAIEQAGGRFFDAKAMTRAVAEFNKRALPDIVRRTAFIGSKGILGNKNQYAKYAPTSKYEAMVEYYRMMDRKADIRESGGGKKRQSYFSRMLDWGYLLQDAGEYNVQTKVGMAILMTKQIRKGGPGGETLSLYDAYTVNGDGSVTLKEGFDTLIDKKGNEIKKWNEKEARYAVRNEIREVNKQIHGNYAYEDRMVIQSYALGQLAAQFHKWVVPAIKARYRKEYYDENVGWIEGRYLSLFSFIRYTSTHLKELGNLKNFKEGFKKHYAEGDVQRGQNKMLGVWRASAELAIMMTVMASSYIIGSLLGEDDDDDDGVIRRRLENALMYQADRSFKEMVQFIPIAPAGIVQIYQMFKSPVAATRTLGELGEALSVTVRSAWFYLYYDEKTFWEDSDFVYQNKPRKGKLKLYKEWADAVPILYGIKRWEDYDRQKSFWIK